MNFLEHIELNPKISMEKGKTYPFVEMANVSTINREPDAIEAKEFTSGVKFEDYDTVVARIEPCLQNGKKFLAKNIGKGFGSTEYLVFRPKDESVDAIFLYYFMQTDFIRKSMIGSMTGSTGRQRVNNDIFKTLDISIPEISTQKRIGEILSTYDDMIENNQKQIRLLEETAQRLYKEWFVDFHFPEYEGIDVTDGVPEGWTQCLLEDVVDFNPKVVLAKDRIKQSVPMSALSTNSMVLNTSDFSYTVSNSGSKFQNGDTLLARITPCLENGKTAYVCGLESEEGAVGSTEYIVMRSRKLNSYMVYLLARTNDFRQTAINSMTGSDGRQRAQVDKIKSYLYLLPPESIVKTFGELVKPLFEEIYSRNNQNRLLMQARDRLLPKLMSGEIEV